MNWFIFCSYCAVMKKSLILSNRPIVNSDVWSLNIALVKNFSKKLNYTTYGEVFMDKLLTAKELAEKLNLSISKLAIDRMKERGIPFIKWKHKGQRGAVRYSMPVVQAFLENNMRAKA